MSRAWHWLVVVAGIAVIAGLVLHTGVSVVAAMLARVGWAIIPIAGLYAIHVTVRALALWRGLPDGLLPFRDVLRVRLSGEAVELLTFSGPWLAEPAKGWLLTRQGLLVSQAFGVITLEYLLYTMVAAWMAAFSLGVLVARHALPRALVVPVLGIEALIAAITIGFCYAVVSGRALIAGALRRIGPSPGRVVSLAVRIEPAERVIVEFLSRRRTRLLEVLATEAIAHLLLAAEIAILFFQMQVGARWGDAFVFEGSSKFISAAFAFVPGQLGAQEGVYTLIAAALGAPAAAGLTLALARRIRNVIVGCFSLAAMWPSTHSTRVDT